MDRIKIIGDEIWYDAIRIGQIDVPPGTLREKALAALRGETAEEDSSATQAALEQEYQRGYDEGVAFCSDDRNEDYWQGYEDGHEEGCREAREEKG